MFLRTIFLSQCEMHLGFRRCQIDLLIKFTSENKKLGTQFEQVSISFFRTYFYISCTLFQIWTFRFAKQRRRFPFDSGPIANHAIFIARLSSHRNKQTVLVIALKSLHKQQTKNNQLLQYWKCCEMLRMLKMLGNADAKQC